MVEGRSVVLHGCERLWSDILSIDIEHKQFYLYKNASDIDVDGCDEFGEEHDSSYVSREVFDMLVEAVKLHGYKEKK